jgi:hypothetical protein
MADARLPGLKRQLYEATVEPSQWQGALATLTRALTGARADLYGFDNTIDHYTFRIERAVDPDFSQRSAPRHWQRYPAIASRDGNPYPVLQYDHQQPGCSLVCLCAIPIPVQRG